MARRKLQAVKGRNQRMEIRVSAGELARIDARAEKAGLSRSDYLRKMALSGKVTVRQSKTDFKLIHELNKIGVNLNQLVHGSHIHGRIPDAIPTLCRKIEDLLDKAMEEEGL